MNIRYEIEFFFYFLCILHKDMINMMGFFLKIKIKWYYILKYYVKEIHYLKYKFINISLIVFQTLLFKVSVLLKKLNNR